MSATESEGSGAPTLEGSRILGIGNLLRDGHSLRNLLEGRLLGQVVDAPVHERDELSPRLVSAIFRSLVRKQVDGGRTLSVASWSWLIVIDHGQLSTRARRRKTYVMRSLQSKPYFYSALSRTSENVASLAHVARLASKLVRKHIQAAARRRRQSPQRMGMLRAPCRMTDSILRRAERPAKRQDA